MTDQEAKRSVRITINQPCRLLPWKVTCKLIDLSLSGALIECDDFPDDFIFQTQGELEFNELILPGQLIRLENLKIAIEFDSKENQMHEKLSSLIEQYR